MKYFQQVNDIWNVVALESVQLSLIIVLRLYPCSYGRLTLKYLKVQMWQIRHINFSNYLLLDGVYNSFSILACIGLIVVVTSHSVTWSGALSGMASQRCIMPTIYNI